MNEVEQYLERWQQAGLLDAAAVVRIREFEEGQKRPSRARWQVVLAISFGAILLAGGVLLFVAAHWDAMSPLARFLLVLSKLALLHGSGAYFSERSPKLSTALHAVGTVAAGAAIALTGQIFNIDEHWPGGLLLWAICASAGLFWLRDAFHEAFAWLLWPTWILCEWLDRTDGLKGQDVYLARMIAVLAAVYLAAFLMKTRTTARVILLAVGAVALTTSMVMLPEGWVTWRTTFNMPWSYRLAATVIMVIFIAAGYLRDKTVLLPAAVVFIAAWLLPFCVHIGNGRWGYQTSEPSVLAYLIVAGVAAFFAWWGVHRNARSLINLGMAGFALTVLWFYFSSLMDKLGRSLGLIALGVLFLAGGWTLERFRRDLIRGLGHQKEAA